MGSQAEWWRDSSILITSPGCVYAPRQLELRRYEPRPFRALRPQMWENLSNTLPILPKPTEARSTSPEPVKSDMSMAGAGLPWQFSISDLLMFMAVVSLYLAACTSIFRGLTNRETAELVGLTASAVAGASFALVFHPRWIRYRSGPLVVFLRLKKSRTVWFAWACWLPLVVILFVPMVRLLPAWQEPKNGGTTWPSFVRGLLVLWMTQNACFAVNSIMRRSWALCDRGLVRDGMFFVPWSTLRKNDWSIDQQGTLVATVAGRRVVTTVPPEQREAVEAVLKEKLSENGTNVHCSEEC